MCLCVYLYLHLYLYVCVCNINFKKWEYLCVYYRFVVQKPWSLEMISIHICVSRSVSRTGVIFLKSEKLTQTSVGGGWAASYILSLTLKSRIMLKEMCYAR